MMNKELYNWLEMRFRKDNHCKYHKYFDLWISNITESQVIGFSKQMYNDVNNIFGSMYN